MNCNLLGAENEMRYRLPLTIYFQVELKVEFSTVLILQPLTEPFYKLSLGIILDFQFTAQSIYPANNLDKAILPDVVQPSTSSSPCGLRLVQVDMFFICSTVQYTLWQLL